MAEIFDFTGARLERDINLSADLADQILHDVAEQMGCEVWALSTFLITHIIARFSIDPEQEARVIAGLRTAADLLERRFSEL